MNRVVVTSEEPVPSSTTRVPSESRQKKIDPTFFRKSRSLETELLRLDMGNLRAAAYLAEA